jgi:hypothetical protein
MCSKDLEKTVAHGFYFKRTWFESQLEHRIFQNVLFDVLLSVSAQIMNQYH